MRRVNFWFHLGRRAPSIMVVVLCLSVLEVDIYTQGSILPKTSVSLVRLAFRIITQSFDCSFQVQNTSMTSSPAGLLMIFLSWSRQMRWRVISCFVSLMVTKGDNSTSPYTMTPPSDSYEQMMRDSSACLSKRNLHLSSLLLALLKYSVQC